MTKTIVKVCFLLVAVPLLPRFTFVIQLVRCTDVRCLFIIQACVHSCVLAKDNSNRIHGTASL